MPGGRIRSRPGLSGGRPARKGEDQWQDTQREYESRIQDLPGYFSITSSASQTVATLATATVDFSGVTLSDFQGVLSLVSGVVTISRGGMWSLRGGVTWNSVTAGGSMTLNLRLLRDGADTLLRQSSTAGAGNSLAQMAARQYRLEKGDKVYLTVGNLDGVDRTLVATTAYLEGFRISA